MASKKKTQRLNRDDVIDKLLDDTTVEDLLSRVDEKHANGGIFSDDAHHKRTQMCMEALTEEELDG